MSYELSAMSFKLRSASNQNQQTTGNQLAPGTIVLHKLAKYNQFLHILGALA